MRTACVIYLLLSGSLLFGHGDPHERIIALTQAIHQFPDSAELYMERGELLLLHEEINEALADFAFCHHSGLKEVRSYLGLSQAYLFLEKPDSALFFINIALAISPDHLPSLETKAEALKQLNHYCEAAIIYSGLIESATQPSPALYLDASYVLMNCDEDDAKSKASTVLLHGMARIGRLHVLEKELVHVYIQQQQYEAALDVQTQIIGHWISKAKPYADRAEIYVLLGNKPAAIEDLHTAIKSLNEIPAYKATTPAMMNLRNRILSLLKEIEG